MELRHLRYFIAVAEAENVSRAASKLHISQPGISRQIRDLEDELGFALFERTAKSLKLTPAGRVFLPEARSVLERAGEAVKAARAVAGGAGELHVGYAPSLTARFLPQTLRAFQTAAPDIRVKLHDFSTEEMAQGLQADTLQMAITIFAKRGVLHHFPKVELTRDTLCLAVAPQHRLAMKLAVTVGDIASESIIAYSRKEYPEAHRFIADLFAETGHKPRIAEEYDSVSSLIAAVEAGNGVAVATHSLECTSGPRLKLIPFSPAPDSIPIVAVWKKLVPAAELFLNCAKESARPR